MNCKQELLKKISFHTAKIGIIGLGYVGLPLAVEFGKKFRVIGFDINQGRIDQLRICIDKTLEVTKEELAETSQLQISNNIDEFKSQDLTPHIKASDKMEKNKVRNLDRRKSN